MIASIIIPCYNHAHVLREAVESALAQTVPCEIIVVDDGSTDSAIVPYEANLHTVTVIRQEHSGPSVARNRGLEMATSEYICFLDADDLIAPNKVELQVEELERHKEYGWCVCDVNIVDSARGTKETASHRYEYASKPLDGWIQPLLVERNIFPIMSPLVRRSVLSHIRFDDSKIPEDWHFWHAVAGAARVRYIPQVLATYRKSRTGRSRTPEQARKVSRNIVHPLRLNLGCGTEGTRSWHPIAGMVNLDKSMGWRFEDGLGDFVTGSVSGITVSHALMYVALKDWPAVFAEFARVLQPGGVLRVTEDDTAHPKSRTHPKGWHDAVTLTSPDLVRRHMGAAGLLSCDVAADETRFSDRSLCQAQHGPTPNVFFVEGIKQSIVLFSPHCDDETLFAAFTILRYRPHVVVCFPSVESYGSDEVRQAETRDAMSVLGGDPVTFWDGKDIVAKMHEIDARLRPTIVFAPHWNCSHPDHSTVAAAAKEVFSGRLRAYHTYDEDGKVRAGEKTAYEPAWVHAKLRALSRYESQATHPRAHVFFMDDLEEWGI